MRSRVEREKKKLMLLGGISYLIPVIEAAHRLGHHVITCDYLPDNIAHRYSDEYHNVSIIDKDAVLQLAQQLRIDGIMSFAVDPGVLTAAYVQEQMGLPGNPYESVAILQNKDQFRSFLRRHGFNTPWARSYDSIESALQDSALFTWPAIVKPTDSAGSKGVTRVNSEQELAPALSRAMQHSLSGRIIIEEFIEKQGYPTGSDSFSIDGILRFTSFDDQHFDPSSPNPYTPSAHIWPSSMPAEHQQELTREIQRLLTLLNMRTSIYNIEARVGLNGKPYIMEVSPRGGGNRLAEVLRHATGVDLITNAVRAAMGEPIEGVEQKPIRGHWAIITLHAETDGIYRGVRFSDELRRHIVEEALLVQPGDNVRAFRGANDAIGHLILRADTREELLPYLDSSPKGISVLMD